MERTTLVQFIRVQEKKADGATGEFTRLMNEILVAGKIISLAVNKAGIGEDILGLTGEVNVQGEEVQKLDEYANNTLLKIIGQSGCVSAIISEECDEAIQFKSGPGPRKYIFAMDPLDGSSNIDVNVSIGTIFSIYRGPEGSDDVEDDAILQAGMNQVAAGYIIYGSSTMFVYTTGQGVHGFTLDPELGEFFLSHPDIKIPDKGKQYSTNEGNQVKWLPEQKALIKYFKETDPETERPYSLRYIGSLVADFHRTLLKGGLFMYPGDQSNPEGKLRYAFEAAPLSFIVETAGGLGSTGKERILDIRPTHIHQRVPLFIGSREDVLTAEKILRENS